MRDEILRIDFDRLGARGGRFFELAPEKVREPHRPVRFREVVVVHQRLEAEFLREFPAPLFASDPLGHLAIRAGAARHRRAISWSIWPDALEQPAYAAA